MRKLRIGLIGFGTVGQALYQMLLDSPNSNAEIVTICVKDRSKRRSLPRERFVFDWREVVACPDVDTIVEVTGDVPDAYQLTAAALKLGKPVISANKRMLALNLDCLSNLAIRTGTPLLYEASTCAGVPIISTLENHHSALDLASLTGVFNASSQFVLSTMESGRLGYEDAVRQAQQAGWAEADPTLDMAGFDTTFKLCLLAAHGFGTIADPNAIARLGIEGISSNDILWARRLGCRIKLVAHAVRENNRLALWVLPELVSSSSKLYALEGESAAVLLEAPSFGYHLVQGKGAGGNVTSSAILADLQALASGYKYTYAKSASGIELSLGTDVTLDIVIRHDRSDRLRSLPLLTQSRLDSDEPCTYTRAQVRLSDLRDDAFRHHSRFVFHVPADTHDDIDTRRAEPASARK